MFGATSVTAATASATRIAAVVHDVDGDRNGVFTETLLARNNAARFKMVVGRCAEGDPRRRVLDRNESGRRDTSSDRAGTADRRLRNRRRAHSSVIARGDHASRERIKSSLTTRCEIEPARSVLLVVWGRATRVVRSRVNG
jgi:hypothetical protein